MNARISREIRALTQTRSFRRWAKRRYATLSHKAKGKARRLIRGHHHRELVDLLAGESLQ